SLDSEIELDLITELVNELLSFNHLHEVWLKKAIWSHYDSSVSNTSYNFVTVNGFENEREANMAFFGIHSQEEVYTSADIEYVWVDVSIVDFRYYNLVFCCPWEGEHGISIGVKNGEIDSII